MLSFKKIEELLPFRRLAYNLGLMHPHLEEGNKSYRCLSTCIYAGKELPYPYSNDLFDCFELPDLARGKIFNPLDLVGRSLRKKHFYKMPQQDLWR